VPDKLLAAADEVIELPVLLRLPRAGYDAVDGSSTGT
jgi:hypothetical protein